MNDVLHRALVNAGLREADVARHLDVDPKTVRRWLTGRLPYPRHRAGIAALLGLDERDLWPLALGTRRPLHQSSSEILATYPHRWAVPRAVWHDLFEGAQREIGILAYAGLFLAEDTGILRTLADRATAGVAVRILLGDPNGARVSERGADESVGGSLAAKIRNALVLYRPLRNLEGIAIRLHDTVLYNSIYRADDDLLINPHAYGVPASNAPVLHLRQREHGDMASTYFESFERVWLNTVELSG
ncbi:XRE family transcriptional regulator [Actinomadura sp. HBU206391]|uniref:XRE family transcriptional regulator n=1 Tax=Actinomadura sp. HBU206391 TaxID=2731692 RepID=UPI00164F3945|nr:XRE family transcriptional regulator [Actinomadura sp. HBU206391]MBC6456351.1 XRE family transcriptional regulator [Actinomadura sp. HBU206391]